jgi:hypothetical protein
MRTLLVLVALFGLVACGEKEQVVVYKQGKYQGKPDGRPWDNDPLAYSGNSGSAKWTKGDRASWEAQIKTRNDSQNENKRIGD